MKLRVRIGIVSLLVAMGSFVTYEQLTFTLGA